MDVFLLTTCAATAAAAIALLMARDERRQFERYERIDHAARRDEQDILKAIRNGDWRLPVLSYQAYPPEPPLDGRRAAMIWRGNQKTRTAQDIKALKYRKLTPMQARSVAAALARQLDRLYFDSGWRVDMVVGVPGDPDRTRQRGFNQSCLIAEELARRIRRPYGHAILTRARQVRSQVEVHSGRARRDNLVDAFTARRCAGRAVLVVDDVATTGATLIECARALKAAGATHVYGLTLAGAHVRSIPRVTRSQRDTPPT